MEANVHAQYALAARRWLPSALSAMREGNPGGLTAGIRWMYTTGAPKDLRLTPKHIDAMYRECYRRAVPFFRDAAKEAAEISVSDTERLLEDAEICASKVDVTPDWDKREIMRRAYEVAIPRTIEWLNRLIPSNDPTDYDYARNRLNEVKRWASDLGISLQTNILEHRLTFTRPRSKKPFIVSLELAGYPVR